MKRAFWILVAGAVFSALMAAGIGRAGDRPVSGYEDGER